MFKPLRARSCASQLDADTFNSKHEKLLFYYDKKKKKKKIYIVIDMNSSLVLSQS